MLGGWGSSKNARIHLKCGDTFPPIELKQGGVGLTQPLLFTSYGTGARPLIQTSGAGFCINASDSALLAEYVWLIGLELAGDSGLDSIGVRQAGYVNRGWLIEDCKIRNVGKGIVGSCFQLAIRRNVIHDCDNTDTSTAGEKDGTGMYLDAAATGVPPGRTVDQLLIEENFIVDCGKLNPTQFKHGVYLQADIQGSDVVVRRNLVGNCADNCIMMRCSGVCEDNHSFQAGGCGLLYGGLSDPIDNFHGVTITSSRNIVSELGHAFPSSRHKYGWGMCLAFIKQLDSTDDMVVHWRTGLEPRALWLRATEAATIPGFLKNVTLRNFLAYNVLRTTNPIPNKSRWIVLIEGPAIPGNVTNCKFIDCRFIDHNDVDAMAWVWEDVVGVNTSTPGALTCQNTILWSAKSNAPPSAWYLITGQTKSLTDWSLYYSDLTQPPS